MNQQTSVSASQTFLVENLVLKTLNREIDLAKFLDDDFLKSDIVDGVPVLPIELTGCKAARGATGHAWQS